MLTEDQRKALSELTGLPRTFFGTLYRTRGENAKGDGAIFYWMLGNSGDPVQFAPASWELVRAEGFHRKLRLEQPLNATKWAPLIASIMATATII